MQSKIITTNEANQRLNKFLHKYLPDAGNNFIFKMLRKKNITLNGKKASGREILLCGDEVKFFMSNETILKFKQSLNEVDIYYNAYRLLGTFEIVFENEHLLIINKPAGLLCQKAKTGDFTLNEWCVGYLLTNGAITPDSLDTFKPSVLNRLDRNTSGLVLCGKTLKGSQEISRLLKENKLRKYYRLYVKGRIAEAGELKDYHYKDEDVNKVKILKETEIKHDGKTSEVITKYRPLKVFSEHSYIEAELVTGKTHQIRAHFSAIGHPLIGDYKYGDRQFNEKYKRLYGVKYQLLHAYRIVFPLMDEPLKDLSELEIKSQQPDIFEDMNQKGKSNGNMEFQGPARLNL